MGSESMKRETRQYVTVPVTASQQAMKRHTTHLACVFALHIGFSAKEFQGQSSPQSSPRKGETRRIVMQLPSIFHSRVGANFSVALSGSTVAAQKGRGRAPNVAL